MPDSKLKLLQDKPIFGGISEETLRFLLGLSCIVSVAKGDFFFREGDKAESVFVLEKGKVAVLKHLKGHDYVLGHLGSRDCFGEMALMDFFPRSASILALEDCVAIEITADALYQIYKNDLQQYTIIQMNMGREVSRRLRETDRQLFESKMEAKIIDGNVIFQHKK